CALPAHDGRTKHDFLVYSFHPQGQIVVRTGEAPTGDSLYLALDSDYLHLFDDHGNRINA
ncbi:MAG: hypothetical protein Q7U40_08830, partial [Desulfatirhabdiaceae bacterium]|nr:hypothetical protein [Desulfatirhabdiaceae bacterium]